MKTFVLAPDSFKGSLTAKEVCEAMEVGFKAARPDDLFLKIPMADGGEGTVQSLVDAVGGLIQEVTVKGPLQQEVVGEIGLLKDGVTGVIEMASASGIDLIRASERNPLMTTTYGTGQLIKACLDRGVQTLIIGLGGSATNDGGTGMAAALGVRFLDEKGKPLPLGGDFLDRLAIIDSSQIDPRLAEMNIIIASDVTNPLCGPTGASAIFGPQKGADIHMVERLDQNLAHYAMLLKEQLQQDVKNIPGSGAAGGTAAGLLAFTAATLQKGVEVVIEQTGLREAIKQADYVITGEGAIDFQTKFGKTPYGVAQLAKTYNKPVIALAGTVGENAEELYAEGIDAVFGITPGPMSLETAIAGAAENIQRTCLHLGRILP